MTIRVRELLAPLFLYSCLAHYPCVAESPGLGPQTIAPAAPPSARSAVQVEILGRQTCEGLGACQGASLHDGFVYLYGDLYQKDHQSGPGIIRQYAFGKDDQGIPHLKDTGLMILLVRHGENIINHPTGLTWNPTFGTYLGNTVTKTKKGTIYRLNWPQMLIDCNLDNAILNVADDDLAVQGCRPEFVRHGDRWLLATADYGPTNNAVRFYDPALLAGAKSTSQSSVLIEQVPCTPWIQQLHRIDPPGLLLIIQNQVEGRRWRLTPAYPWQPGAATDFRSLPPYDEIPDPTELEGFTMIDREFCVLVTSSPKDNVTIARLKMRAAAGLEHGTPSP